MSEITPLRIFQPHPGRHGALTAPPSSHVAEACSCASGNESSLSASTVSGPSPPIIFTIPLTCGESADHADLFLLKSAYACASTRVKAAISFGFSAAHFLSTTRLSYVGTDAA